MCVTNQSWTSLRSRKARPSPRLEVVEKQKSGHKGHKDVDTRDRGVQGGEIKRPQELNGPLVDDHLQKQAEISLQTRGIPVSQMHLMQDLTFQLSNEFAKLSKRALTIDGQV